MSRERSSRVGVSGGAEHAGDTARTPGRRTRIAAARVRRASNGSAPSAGVVAGGGGGQPLPGGLEARLGAALGADVSSVRVHTGSESAESAAALGAHAYALGQDIHFGAGKYDPASTEGERLIAHEVAHTVQQGPGAPAEEQCDLEVSVPGDASEVEADRFADSFVAGGGGPVAPVAPGTVSRQVIQRDEVMPREHAEVLSAMQAQIDAAVLSSMTMRQLRTTTGEALYRYDARMKNLIDRKREWLSNNWLEYLKHAWKNRRLGWSHGMVEGTLQNAAGNVVSEGAAWGATQVLGKAGVAAAGAAIGTALFPGAGTIIGFVVGVLIEQAVSMIWEQIGGNPDEAAASEGARIALEEYGQKQRQFAAEANEAKAAHDESHHMMMRRKDDEETREGMLAIWADATTLASKVKAPPPADDLTLAHELLHDWVLEHAGDEEDADSQTSEDHWETARDLAFGEGDLDKHPEIFAYQTRGLWERTGVSDVRELSVMMYDSNELRAQAESGEHDEDPADRAMAEYDGRKMRLYDMVDPERFIAFVEAHLPRRYHHLLDDGREAIREDDVEVDCELDLTTSDGACYVDHWIYTITFPEGVWGVLHPRSDPTTITHLTVSPD